MSIPLRVDTLCNGGLVERIHEEIQKVVANVADPNTEAKKPRKVKMEMVIKPNEHRNMAEVTVSVTSTMQAAKPIETGIMMEFDPRTGELGASEMRPGENYGQGSLPGTPEVGKITNFNPDRKTAAAGR